jgi:hypothetical protein
MDINTKLSYVTDSTTNVINGTYVLSPYFVNTSIYLLWVFVYALIDLVFAEFSFYSLFSFALAAIWLTFPIIDGIWLNLGLFLLTNYGMRYVFLKMSAYAPWLATEYALKFIKKEDEEQVSASEDMEDPVEEIEESSECCRGSDRITLEHRPSYPASYVETYTEEPGMSVEDVVEAVIVSEVVSEVVESIIDNSSEESYQSESTDYSPSSYETSEDSSSDDED